MGVESTARMCHSTAGILHRVSRADFPTTQATWIDDAVHCGDSEALRAHFLSSYREPLLALLRAHAPALAHDAEEIVHAFLLRVFGDSASAATDYAARARASGMRMRRFIANGLLFHARGVLRDRRRMENRFEALEVDWIADYPTLAPAADEAFERAWAQSLVREACKRVEQALQESTRGRSNLAWHVFRRHALDGRRYGDLVEELGLSEQQMADLVRGVSQRLRAEIQSALALEGIPGPEIADELDRLLRCLEA